MSKAQIHSSGPLDDPDSEEYEYMNKQASVTTLPPRRSAIRDSFKGPKTTRRRSSTVQPQDAACSGEVVTSREDSRGHTGNKNKGTNHSSDSEDQVSREVAYEYMDVRAFETEKDGPPTREPPHPKTTNHEDTRIRGEVEDKEDEDEYVEDDNYHYTNRQPNLRQALQGGKGSKMPGMGEGEAYEYEEMDSLAAAAAGHSAEYENLQGQEEGAVGGTETQQSGFGPSVKVRAGVGVVEPDSADRSFDNPDYWHSRMFLNAVRT